MAHGVSKVRYNETRRLREEKLRGKRAAKETARRAKRGLPPVGAKPGSREAYEEGRASAQAACEKENGER